MIRHKPSSRITLSSHKNNNSALKDFRHKKSLGQHFLKSDEIASQIVSALTEKNNCNTILEIGPGLGILTTHLLKLPGKEIYVSEIDDRVTEYLSSELKIPSSKIIKGDFLQMEISRIFEDQVCIIGNFPYNISSQILFRVLENKMKVPMLVGMFQKEMARRVTAKPGNRDIGVISILVQAYYDVEYLFELSPAEFDPPPKIFSAVIRITRKNELPDCDEELLRLVVKTAYGQRRKKLSNSLATINGLNEILTENNFDKLRAEQLSVDQYIFLAKKLKDLR